MLNHFKKVLTLVCFLYYPILHLEKIYIFVFDRDIEDVSFWLVTNYTRVDLYKRTCIYMHNTL